MTISESVEKLANAMEMGHLLMATSDGSEILGAAADTITDQRKRIGELEAACRNKDNAYAEAMCLVFNHEGHIEKIIKELKECQKK